MNNKVANFLMLVTGAAIGSVVTWKLVKDKYERISREEIAEMRDYYYKRRDELERAEYEHIANTYTSTDIEKPTVQLHTDETVGADDEDEVDSTEPYVISPEEYGQGDYDMFSYTYYADGVLADEADEVIEDIDDVIGLDALDHIGDEVPNAVYVRNDNNMADYEILKSPERYSDILLEQRYDPEN